MRAQSCWQPDPKTRLEQQQAYSSEPLEGSTGLIVGGIDAALANAFGYIGCCGHVRSHGET